MLSNNQNNKPQNKKSQYLILIFGVLSLFLYLFLSSVAHMESSACVTISILFLVITSGIYMLFSRDSSLSDSEFGRSLGHVMIDIVIKLHLPVVLCDKTGKIIWRNRAYGVITQNMQSVMGSNVGTLMNFDMDMLEDDVTFMVDFDDRHFETRPLKFKTGEKQYWFIAFTDLTDHYRLVSKVESERSVVAYIIVDNLDELAQHVQDSYSAQVNDVSNILREFATSLNAILKEYDRNKCILITNRDGLMKCKDSHFDILDSVRNVKVGDMGLPVTVSIGISDVGDTLRARENSAREALGMALARGGDQVVYKGEGGLEFFGGNTRPVQKRSSVAAKVRSNALVARISNASNVLIMGHGGADQDCFGAAVGIARLAMYCYVKPYIIVDFADKNTKSFIEKFEKLPEYSDIFIDANDAQNLITTETLLIVVDVNNIDHMIAPGVALTVENAIVIDHHRKTGDSHGREWLAEYIEPSASSASELVAEVLEQSTTDGMLLKEEADALLGGIILDTKQFTKSTGTRTFNAAIYLRSAGASIYESAKELKSDYAEFKKQSKILSDLVIYKNRFAIAKDEDDGEAIDRIAAAKSAENLLTIKGVDAAFALIRINGETHISARSNASVSVQLILEKMGGGGHLDSAGAKSSDAMLTALGRLKDAIDEYLEENSEAR